MANLIITIISIALIAVAALMGAYYGGSAFSEAQSKAIATRLLSQGRQIASAWNVFAVNNGGSTTMTDITWTDNSATDLVPNYLSELPINDATIQAYNWHAVDLTNISAAVAADLDGLEIGVMSTKVCNQLAIMARGPGSTPVLRTNNDIAALLGSRSFDCFWSDNNANGTVDDRPTDKLTLALRVFN